MKEHRLGHYPPKEFPAPLRAIAFVSRVLATAEGVGIALFLAAVVLISVYGVLSFNIRNDHVLTVGGHDWFHFHGKRWFPEAPMWSRDVQRHSVFVLGFLGAGYAAYTAQHIRIDAVTRLARPMGRLIMRVVTTIAALLIVAALIKGSFRFLAQAAELEVDASNTSKIFTSTRGTWVIIGGLLLIEFHFFVQLLLDAWWVIRWKTPPADWIAEATHGGEAPDEEVVPDPEQAASK